MEREGDDLEEAPHKVPGGPLLPPRRLGEEWEQAGPRVNGRGGVLPGVETAPGQRKRPSKLVEKGSRKLRNVASGKVRRSIWEKETLTQLLKRALKADDGYWAQRVINGLILKAAKGNPAAQKLVWDRCEGMLKEQLELSGDVTFQKQVVLTDLRGQLPELPEPMQTQGEVVIESVPLPVVGEERREGS